MVQRADGSSSSTITSSSGFSSETKLPYRTGEVRITAIPDVDLDDDLDDEVAGRRVVEPCGTGGRVGDVGPTRGLAAPTRPRLRR